MDENEAFMVVCLFHLVSWQEPESTDVHHMKTNLFKNKNMMAILCLDP